MPASLLNQNGIWGVTVGMMPSNDALVLQVPVDLSAGSQTFDLEREIMAGAIDFIQSVFIDNTPNNAALFLQVGILNHRICVPPNSQGIFTVLMPPGGAPITFTGPAAKFNILFSNVPVLTTVWKNA